MRLVRNQNTKHPGISIRTEVPHSDPVPLGNDFLRIRAILILSGLAFLRQKHNQDNDANHRDQGDENPPTATVRIVKSPNANTDAGDEDGQVIENPQCTGQTDDSINYVEDHRDDDVEQEEHPIFLPS